MTITAGKMQAIALNLIPPSPVTDQIEIEIRGAVLSLPPVARFHPFEFVCAYQYPGIFCDPKSHLKPGGNPAVQLFRDYQAYRDLKQDEKSSRS